MAKNIFSNKIDFNDGLGVLPISKGGTGVTSASEVLNVVGGIPANAKKMLLTV